MIIYNVTSQVVPEVLENWLEWMQSYYIPKVLSTEYFKEVTILRVLIDQTTNPTYAVQYKANSKELLQHYLETAAKEHKKEIQQKFGTQVLSFETHLEQISKQS